MNTRSCQDINQIERICWQGIIDYVSVCVRARALRIEA